MVRRVSRVDFKRARVDYIFTVVQDSHFWRLGRTVDLPKHFVEHLSLRGGAREGIDDHADAFRIFLGERHCHVTGARVVWIYSEIEPHARYCDPRKVTFDHPGEDVLFMPVGDEYPHCGDLG